MIRLSSPVAPFTDAMLEIKTTPGARCDITVRYKSGSARLLPAASEEGRVPCAPAHGADVIPITRARSRET